MTAETDSLAPASGPENTKKTAQKEWTVMIYMAGANNLSADMVYAMQRLRQAAGSITDANLFVYFDGQSPSIPTLYCDFSDPDGEFRYYRSHTIKQKLYDGHRKFNENSAAMRSIANFVDWCVNRVEHEQDGEKVFGRKAERYALIFSGHSMGFQSIGLLKDEGADYHMTLERMEWMLKRLTKKRHELERLEHERADEKGYEIDTRSAAWKEDTTEVLGQKFDILGFDSCVMGMLEVGVQFRDVARTLIASEGSIPNAGWTYAELLGRLTVESSTDSTGEIAKDFVRKFITLQDRNTLAGISVDMAAWDLRALHDLEAPFVEFTHSLLACFKRKGSRTYTQMRRLLTYVHWRCQSYMFEQNVDLGDLCSLIIEEIDNLRAEGADLSDGLITAVADSAEVLLDAVRAAVLYRGFSGGKYQYSNGIAIFFPWSLSSYEVSKQNYRDLTFVEETEAGQLWDRFLEVFVGDVTLRRSKQAGEDPVEGIVYLNHRFYSSNVETAGDTDGKIPENGSDKIPENGSDKIPENGSDKIPENGTDKIPENGTDKIPENGTDKIPENGTDKIPENATDKIPENGTDKIPENGTDKIFGSAGLFFQEFMSFKNIQTFWNVSGLSETDPRTWGVAKPEGPPIYVTALSDDAD